MTLQQWDNLYRQSKPEMTLEELVIKRNQAKLLCEALNESQVIAPTDAELWEVRI